MRILLAAATILSCACANTAQNLPPVLGAPENRPTAISKGANIANGTLKSFDSERALRRAISDVQHERERLRKKQREKDRQDCLEWSKSLPGKVDCNHVVSESVTVTGMVAREDEDTNNQHNGVDEGGLVKKVGDLLVVLRRGRLFTIDTSGAQLAAVDMADLASKESNTNDSHDWYDELLVSNQTVIVIGYSNARGGTEIVLFNLREGGRLDHRATYNLRSDDYYSGENYASRLVGGRLILYTTRSLPDEAADLNWLPAMRRWQPGGTAAGFERIVSWDRVFRQTTPLGAFPTAHTMVSCDPSAIEFTCEASVLLADYLSVYYASPTAGYAWTQDWTNYPDKKPRSNLYRIPFDGSPISALQVHGDPQNQLAFLESDDAHLNVLVQDSESNDSSRTSLLRVPLSWFGDGSVAAPEGSYRVLARDFEWPSRRFVGEFVLVGGASRDGANRLVAARWRSSEAVTLPIQHGIERIERIGDGAIVIGTHGDGLGMTTISLVAAPVSVTTLVVEDARQSETRTHGFLYRAESAKEGLFGLPLVTSTSSTESASVLFVRNHGLALHAAGMLDVSETSEDDNCLVSCVDWYGNARAIFAGVRVFALMGYELIEGRIGSDGQVIETTRLNFNPGARTSQ